MISIHPAKLSPEQAAAAEATHGMGLVQDVISCTLIQRLNGDRSLRLQAPYTEHNHGLLTDDRLIFADGQFYRIARSGRSDRGGQKSISIEALHVIYDLQQSSIENIETKEDPNFVDGITAGEALGQVLSGSAFTPGTVDIDPAKRDYLEILRENRLDCLTQIIDTWGGEIVPDNWTIHLLHESGADRGVQLRLARNMDGLDIDEDISAVKTRLHIVGYQDASIESVNDGKDYLDSPNIGLYSQVREDYAYFEDIDDPAELKRLGLERLSEVDKVQLTARVDLVRLRQCAPYHHYAELDRIALGDTVAVIHDKFGSISVRVLEREAEILRDGTVINTRLTLGNAQADQFFRGFRAAAEAAREARRQAAQAAQTANTAKALTAQQQALLNQANEQIAQAEQRIQDAETQIADAGQALAGAQSTLTEHGLRIDQTESDIASKASQASVDALNQTVTNQGTAITQNATDIASKTEKTQVNVLQQTVTNQGTLISQNATDIASKAEKTVVDTLNGTVNSHTTQINQNAAEIASKASQSAVDTLNGTVTNQGTQITQNAAAIAQRATKSEVNALTGRVSQNESTIQQTPGLISQAVENIQVGGRNFVPYSDFREDQLSNGWAGWSATALSRFPSQNAVRWYLTAGTTTGIVTPELTEIPKAGDTWTISFEAGLNVGATMDYCYVLNADVGNRPITGLGGTLPVIPSGQYKFGKYSITITFADNYTTPVKILLGFFNSANNAIMLIRKIMVEYGNKPSDWSPAPEDMDARMSAAELKITDDTITQIVTQSTTYTNDLAGKTSTYRQSTTPTAKAIGDLWIDTGNGNALKRWNGTSWVLSQDGGIAAAQTTANNAALAASTADGKAVAAQNAANTADGKAVAAQTAANNAAAAASAAQTAANNAQTTANSRNRTYQSTSAPASPVTGDLWINPNANSEVRRWNGSSWVLAQDTRIASTASTVSSTLNSTGIYNLVSQSTGYVNDLGAKATVDSVATLNTTVGNINAAVQTIQGGVTNKSMLEMADDRATIAVSSLSLDAVNFIKNGDFTSNPKNEWWQGSINSGFARNNKISMRVQSAGAGQTKSLYQNVIPEAYVLRDISSLTVSFYVFVPTEYKNSFPDKRFVVFSGFDSNNATVFYNTRVLSTINGGWNRVVITQDNITDSIKKLRVYFEANEGYYIDVQDVMLQAGKNATGFVRHATDPASGVKTAGIEIGPGTMNLYASLAYSEQFGSGSTEMGRANTRSDGLGFWMGGSPTTAKNRQWMNGVAQFKEIRLGNTAVNQIGNLYTYFYKNIASVPGTSLSFPFYVPDQALGVQNVRVFVHNSVPTYYSPGVGMQSDVSLYPTSGGGFRLLCDLNFAGANESQRYDFNTATIFTLLSDDIIATAGRDITALLDTNNGLITRGRHMIEILPTTGAVCFAVTLVISTTGLQPASAPY